MRKLIVLVVISLLFFNMSAQNINLLEPIKSGEMSLMDALNKRKSTREFSQEIIDNQTLSNLLWAANGINRPDGRRTAPSARNKQEIDIYVFNETAVYLYAPESHSLIMIKEGDFRKDAVKQDFAQQAPLILIYVANYDKMKDMDEESRQFYGATDCGNVSQNVYLFCAANNLNTVALGMINRDILKELIGFNGKAILGQPIGLSK